MKKVKAVGIFSGVVIVALLLYGIISNQDKEGVKLSGIDNRIIVDQLEDEGVEAFLFYESDFDIGGVTKSYLWKDKMLQDYDDDFYLTFSNVYSMQDVRELSSKLEIPDVFTEFGQLYFFEDYGDFKFYLFDGFNINKNVWTCFIQTDEEIVQIEIEKKFQKLFIDSFQLHNNKIYLFSRRTDALDSDIILYEIDMNGKYNIIEIPFSKLDMDMLMVQYGKIFMQENGLIIYTNTPEQSYILKYDFIGKQSIKITLPYIVHKLVSYGQGYLGIVTKKDGIYIEKYDTDINKISSNRVNIDLDGKTPVIGIRDYFFYVYNDKIYGSLSLEGIRNVNFIIVINALDGNVDYLEELVNTEYQYAKQYIWCKLNEGGASKVLNMY